MTKNQNRIIFLFLGLLIGVVSTICIYKVKDFLDHFKGKQFSHSSDNLKEKFSRVGVELPEKAYNIDFYYTSGIDYTCWIAFSASDNDIQETIQGLEVKSQSKEKYEPTFYLPKDKNGKTLLVWWPESTKDFDIYYGQFCWMGYDKKNSRLYIYKFST